MKSRASLAALAVVLLASPVAAQTGVAVPEEPQGTGPRGSSQPAAGERRFDAIGYATIGSGAGVTVSATGLTDGFAEVTAIDTGKTIVAIVASDAPPAGRIATLSRAAAAALGLNTDRAGVRVRPIDAPGPEIAALRAGQANVRMDAPPALLAALRRKLPPLPAAAPSVPATATKPPARRPGVRPVPLAKPAAPPAPTAAPAATAEPAPVAAPAPSVLAPGFYVQYAALSSLDRATALASKVGGVIERTDAVFRVHRGPYAADAEAKRERARATGLGYRDAQIIRIIP